jgi:cell division protein FtsN
MSDADFHKDRPSLQLPGKEFIIVVVVVFSSLSFTLGYFVGKSGADRKAETLSQAQEIAPIPPQKQEPAVPLQPQEAPTSGGAPLNQEQTQPQQKEPPAIVVTKEAEPAKTLPPVKEKRLPQAGPQQMSEDDHQKPASENNVSRESKKPEGPVYTVQIGAFKSSAEAEACRKKQAKNKLKTYITVATNKKKEKTYKVRTGEFRDKKSAEVLSLKLAKTEKLKTFVTLKSE